MTERTRTHETASKVGETVSVYGWIHSRRDHGKVTFFDLRDRWGLLQVVVFGDMIERVKDIRPEWVVKMTGTVALRPEKLINPDLLSGTVELQVASVEVVSKAETPPFQLDQDTLQVDEETRLTYRYLDLRSERMTKNLELRHKIIGHARNYLNERGFIEVETPTLTKGTPEGAREFIVPSRLHVGSFYVLPQSPQQYKQLLMIAGIDRYYQLAHAFRDEDQRGDRQPEHTQLDIEMAFVTQDDILELMEQLFTDLVANVTPTKRLAALPWPRITYKQAMEQYGTDKPDLRKDKNDPDELAFAFITDFPLFGKNSSGEVVAEHHPFCMPNPEDIDKLDSDPFAVRGWTYDMVCNGYELASGSIRIHDPNLQRKIFQILKLSEAEIDARFGHLLKAYNYGAPSHGGIAPGIDRLTMILANEPNIREVIAFPKTGDAREPLTGAPTPLVDQSLKDAHIELRKTAKATEK